MKHTRFEYKVEVTISFTGREIKALRKWSQNHYDSRCKAASMPVREGFLNGLANKWVWEHDEHNLSCNIEQYEDSDPILDKVVLDTLSMGDLDILAKIAEAEHNYRLFGGRPVPGEYGRQIAEIRKEADEEWKRLERDAPCLS